MVATRATLPAGTLLLPTQSGLASLPDRRERAHPRKNAAFFDRKNSVASHSSYDVTPGGDIQPTQCAARCQLRIALGLFTPIVPSASMMRPPPSPICHSSALQVKP